MVLSTADVGDTMHITAAYTNRLTGEAADPTAVTLEVTDPNEVETIYSDATTPAVVRAGAGLYHCDVVVGVAGRWRYRWVATGAVVAVESGEIEVRG